jgi:general secretion pathway protein K
MRWAAGTAVISALLATTLAAAMAMMLLVKADRWIDRVAVSRDKGQAYELTRGGLDYARGILTADARLSSVDTLEEDWARILPPIRHEGGEISGRIDDLQGRFNLNNLRRESGVVDEQALAAYRRLLAALGLSDALADTLADWLDADDSRRAAGAERAEYHAQGRNGPTNRPVELLSRVQDVNGYSATIIDRLEPYVSALPGQQAVNVNTAPPEVLHAIQPALGLSEARALALARRQTPFRSEPDFRNRLSATNAPSSLLPLTTASSWFVIHVEARAGRSRGLLAAMVERANGGGSTHIAWISLQ